MTILITISGALLFLVFSLVKSKTKSKEAVKIAKSMFLNSISEIVGVMALVALVLSLIPPELIKSLLGGANKILSSLFGALIGTITIMPAFIAFPLSKSLFINGAHIMAIASFLTTLTMVGVATLPIEIKHFGIRFTIIRNSLSFVMALIIAIGIGVLI